MSSILTILWTPPTGQTSTSSTATSYKVAYKTQTGATYTNITGITGTSVSITGLTNDTYVGYVQTNCSTCTSNTTAAFTGITLDCGISGTAVYYNYIGGTFPPIPTATPTPSVTPTPTPTPTPDTQYYLLLERCDAAPGTVTGWTQNSYTQAQCQVGDIFYSAGLYYYQVINYNLSNQGGTIQGSKNTNGWTSCSQTPNAYQPPTYRTAHINLFRNPAYTSYTQIQTGMCGKDPSQFASGFTSGGAYAGAFVTGTTLTPGVLYDLYQSATDGTPKWTGSGSYWWGAIVYNTFSQVDYIVRIENGAITEWRDCTSGNIIYP